MLETLALAGDDDGQARLATELGRSPAPAADSVLGRSAPITRQDDRQSGARALLLRRSRAAARLR